jgi:hypothetical protein
MIKTMDSTMLPTMMTGKARLYSIRLLVEESQNERFVVGAKRSPPKPP